MGSAGEDLVLPYSARCSAQRYSRGSTLCTETAEVDVSPVPKWVNGRGSHACCGDSFANDHATLHNGEGAEDVVTRLGSQDAAKTDLIFAGVACVFPEQVGC